MSAISVFKYYYYCWDLGSLSSVENSFISWSSTAVSHEAVLFKYYYALSDETVRGRLSVLVLSFTELLVTSRSTHANQQL